VKLAIVMNALQLDADDAADRLRAGGGVIRRVVTAEPPPVSQHRS
jgi:N-acetylmuramic acid 6-phosphate (MurNAc-6-P) etherase